jgi:hypothetical protein
LVFGLSILNEALTIDFWKLWGSLRPRQQPNVYRLDFLRAGLVAVRTALLADIVLALSVDIAAIFISSAPAVNEAWPCVNSFAISEIITPAAAMSAALAASPAIRINSSFPDLAASTI